MKRLTDIFSHRRWWYLSFMLSGMVLSFSKWVVFSGALPPADFGIYSTVVTTIAFLSYFGIFGLNEYLIKEGAALAGKGQTDEINRIRDELLVVGMLNSAVIIGLGLSVIHFFDVGHLTAFQYTLSAGILSISVAFNIVDASLRAALKFLPFAIMVFLRSALLMVMGYSLVRQLGLTGVLVAEAISGLAGVVYACYAVGTRPALSMVRLSRDMFIEYLSKGKCFLGLQTFRYSSFAVDKWIVGWFLGAAALGFYAFIMVTFLAFTALAGIFNAVIIPRVISAFSNNADFRDLYSTTVKLSIGFLAISVLLAPAYFFLADLVIDAYFGQYSFDGIVWALGFVYFGSALHVSHHFFDGFFYSLGRQVELMLIAALGLIVFVACFFLAGVYFPTIIYFSLAFLLAKASLFIITLYRVISGAHSSNFKDGT